jgi:hypothetical protein
MDQQRHCAQLLLNRQKNDIRQQLQKIPLPAVIGLALISGFLAQRLFHFPTPSRMFRLFLTWRAL